MKAIYFKELKSYFKQVSGYLFFTVFSLFFSVLFYKDCLIAGRGNLSDIFSSAGLLVIILVPLLTVGMFTTEKKQNTWTLLLASPVSDIGITMAKYFAALTLCAVCVLSTWIYAAVLALYTTVYIGEIFSCQTGLFLLFAAGISIGEMISAFSKRRLTAAVFTVLAMFLIYILGISASYLGSAFLSSIFNVISPYAAFSRFSRGMFSFSSVMYVVIFCAVCLIAAERSVEYGRMRGV